ncbi:MAG: hypothetical protein WCC08_23545, partial [Terrimicrobiaceae bacterium]
QRPNLFAKGYDTSFFDAIHVELLPSLRTAVFMCVGEYQKIRASFGASAHTGAGENPRQAIDVL